MKIRTRRLYIRLTQMSMKNTQVKFVIPEREAEGLSCTIARKSRNY